MSLPSPANITIEHIKACLAQYPSLVETHYKNRIKDPKKATEAIKRDVWRYDELPKALGHQHDSGVKEISLDISQLEKLVQWKITHGHGRPFLPAMIRKNEPKVVVTKTAKASSYFSKIVQPLEAKDTKHILTWSDVQKGLEAVSELKGVGPATASLIASVYAPTEVSFFADETYAWLLNDGDGSMKLKYDKKEYKALFDEVDRLRKRLGHGNLGCLELEKAVFVLMHLDLLESEKREALKEALKGAVSSIMPKQVDEPTEIQPSKHEIKATATPKKLLPKGSKRNLKTTDSTNKTEKGNESQRRSKRVKTR